MDNSRTYAINGTTLWVEDKGPTNGPVILCLHSLFLDGSMFANLEQAAIPEFRVICPDFRGQGCSAPTVERTVTMDQCADDMLLLIEEMGLEAVHLVGASMGGDVAARMAARRPDLFRSLIFMGSSVREEPKEQADQFGIWLESCAEVGFVGDNLALLQAVMFGEKTRNRPDFEASFAPWLQKLSLIRKSLFPAMYGVLERPSATHELPKITVPTLVYSGTDDFARPPAWGKEIADNVPGAKQTILDAIGHSPILEAPEIVIPGTLEFIRATSTR
ncbi:alpha/beta hydrolase [Tritonibacter mobilis]|nr:alpha/beta hydrolase [Tritonibacter mobilis]